VTTAETGEPFEAIHLRSKHRARLLEAVAEHARSRGLSPIELDPGLDGRARADRWHAVVSPESAGWLTVYPEAMTDPDELLRHLSGALGCRGLIVAGQPGLLWALEAAHDGETVARYRSDRPPEAADLAELGQALAPATGAWDPGPALAELLGGAAGPEELAWAALRDLLGIPRPAPHYDAIAPAVLAAEPAARGHDLLAFSRTGLKRPAPPDEPLAPLPPRTPATR